MLSLSTAMAYDQLADWYRRTVSPNYGLSALRRAMRFAGSKGTALDVGCGSEGRFIEEMLRDGFEVVEGVDASAGMLALAKARHPGVTFHEADISAWIPPRRYDLIIAWDSTFHLPLDQQEPVLRKLRATLQSDGVLLFACGGTEGPIDITGVMEGVEVAYSSLGVNAYLSILGSCG